MLLVKDFMSTTPVTATPDTDVVEAARIMIENGFNGLPVVDGDGTLVGIICQSDLITQQKKVRLPSVFTILDGMIPLTSTAAYEQELEKMAAVSVGQAMTRDVVSVGPDTPVHEVATLMVDRKLHTLPVVENGLLVGVVGKEDVLRTLLPGQG